MERNGECRAGSESGSPLVLLQSLQIWDAQAGGTWAPSAPPPGNAVLALRAEPGEAETANHTDFLNILILKVIKTPLRMLQCSFDFPHSIFCFLQLPNAALKLKLGLGPPVFYIPVPVEGDPG